VAFKIGQNAFPAGALLGSSRRSLRPPNRLGRVSPHIDCSAFGACHSAPRFEGALPHPKYFPVEPHLYAVTQPLWVGAYIMGVPTFQNLRWGVEHPILVYLVICNWLLNCTKGDESDYKLLLSTF